ncbi:hypothetical protein LBBP_04355 [Leptospira borgpetersenii serovar Ballum]|uniref:Uncharacterized protein n=1 Tax=Leptospira borgpetersenii serovar Ballum TaxID=280505 RepID=A0A0S2IXT9_LEPBO|nr:hypothetical protein LBBP_04307 [Leptospira borgpetersenii serovar Ballum]ALO28466.1 hypothetical protein LBBP_04355 [Leptospira borgpetersenii serovar Ballum]
MDVDETMQSLRRFPLLRNLSHRVSLNKPKILLFFPPP